MKGTSMNPIRTLLVFLLLGLSMPVFAQTCAAPIPITALSPMSGNTCASTNQLPYLANGAISFLGNQDIYHLAVADGTQVQVHVTPEAGLDLAVFVCRNQCSTYATCVATVDDGGAGVQETAPLPDGPGDYYVIVGTAVSALTCGNYQLTVSMPLDQPK
jgi:hypothetical protein